MVSDTIARSGRVMDTGRNRCFKLSGMSCLVESVLLAGVSVTNLHNKDTIFIFWGVFLV